MTIHYQKRPSSELANLAWAILVAIKIAQQEGKALSKFNQHIFIMQWLHCAVKKKLFPKSVANDIQWLLNQGKKYGHNAELYKKVDYIYQASSGELEGQRTLFKFTYFIETLKVMGWKDYLVSIDEWKSITGLATVNRAIYTCKSSLNKSFTSDGTILTPITLKMTGDFKGVDSLLKQCFLTNTIKHISTNLVEVTIEK